MPIEVFVVGAYRIRPIAMYKAFFSTGIYGDFSVKDSKLYFRFKEGQPQGCAPANPIHSKSKT
jgi:hypothetical protein